jgi:fructose-specific phosphotransferase system IIC component
VAKNSGKKTADKELQKKEFEAELSKSWLSMRTGLIIMGLVSLAFAGFVAWNYVESAGLFKAILIGLLFAAILWAIFIGNFYFNRFLRRKNKQ